MHRATPVNSSFRAYVAGGARCLVEVTDDKKEMQECTAWFMKTEQRVEIECPQNYGFTSRVIDAEKDGELIEKCSEGFVQYMGGNRSFPVIEVMDDRRYRLRNYITDEVSMYDWQQQSIKIKKKEIQTRSQYRITLRLIKDEEQYKEDKPRDQEKSEDKALSSQIFDKDTIHILRTDDTGKLAATSPEKPPEKEKDKEGKMKSQAIWAMNPDAKETDTIT